MRLKIHSEMRIGGFTLIELSIVLVIIGLIVGGVLIGQDLIEQARIRQSIRQIEQLHTATNAFRLKYNAFPGDLTDRQADGFHFTARSGAAAHGDGNGVLASCVLPESPLVDLYDYRSRSLGCETALYWSDLLAAGMIVEQFTRAIDDGVVAPDDVTLRQYLPASKLGAGTYIIAYGNDNMNYYQILGINSVSQDVSLVGIYSYNNALTPHQAWSIDQKIDDGLPRSGFVTAYRLTLGGMGSFIDVEGTTVDIQKLCYDNTANVYSTATSTKVNTPNCRIRLPINN